MDIKPIETVYNGYKFRSRAEARWAVFFDAAGINYMYEPEGLRFDDGTMYLPDFYLPDQKTFFECKGVMSKQDEHKIEQLAKSITNSNKCRELIIGFADMTFKTAWWVDESMNVSLFHDGSYMDYCDESWLCRCHKCGKLFFMPSWFGWECRCCGYYDGDSGFDILCEGNGDNSWYKYKPLDIARQARFEHGEKPVI